MDRRHDAGLTLRDAFADAAAEIAGEELQVEEPPRRLADSGIDFLVRLAGTTLAVEVKAAPTIADVHRLASIELQGDTYKVLVAGRISRSVRELLRDVGIGFYDARGHLRLLHPPLWIDAPARALASTTTIERTDPLASSGALDVALCLLDEPDVLERCSLRRLARAVDRAPSTVSKALRALRDDYLVDDRNRPVVPDLFRAVLRHWRPKRVPLADVPRPRPGRLGDRLELRLDAAPLTPGWALGGGHAALEWGAPVVLLTDTPPDFYVPSARVLNMALTSFGSAEFGEHACTVAAAPAPFVVRYRSPSAVRQRSSFPVVRPVVAALDLASDPGRGSETLELWNERLDARIARVW